NSSAGKAAAMTALREWLAADPAPLPGAVMLSWDGYAVQAPPPAEPGEEPVRYRFEQHRFTLLRSGLVYAATVLVAVGDGGAAAVVGTPGIVQSPGVELDIAVGQWIGLAETTAPGPVREAVESWARAYASGDANALRREVQDR